MDNPKFFRTALFLIVVLITTVGCNVDIYPKLLSSDRPSGQMTFLYEHRSYERPQLHWESAMEVARERCIEWGYSGAQRYEVGEKDCLSPSESGCNLWQIKHVVYCYD